MNLQFWINIFSKGSMASKNWRERTIHFICLYLKHLSHVFNSKVLPMSQIKMLQTWVNERWLHWTTWQVFERFTPEAKLHWFLQTAPPHMERVIIWFRYEEKLKYRLKMNQSFISQLFLSTLGATGNRWYCVNYEVCPIQMISLTSPSLLCQ